MSSTRFRPPDAAVSFFDLNRRYNGAMSVILQMPRPAEFGATRWQIWRSRAVAAFGALCNRAGLAGAVRNCEIEDDLSGQSLKIRTTPRFTLISVNGRDYYFHRLSGRFDGTGCGCSHPTR